MDRRMHPWRMDEQWIETTRLYNTIQIFKKKYFACSTMDRTGEYRVK